ncbi:MAG: cytochrome c, partial [Gammaproteobacteria bacterium]|nr:cytochrome c [Gammaproteobacteria bacterium]
RLIRTVLHGVQGAIEIKGERYDEIMPGHAFLGDQEIAALLTYIRSSFGNAAEPVHESEVVLVRNTDVRSTPWPADELRTRTGLVRDSR